MRLHRFGELLEGNPTETAAWILIWLRERVNAGDPRARRVGLGLLDRQRLAQILDEHRLRAIAAALDRLEPAARALLVEDLRGAGHDDDELAPPPTEPVGYRLTQARQQPPLKIERLLFDPDVRVVRAALDNPRLTEAEVVKLAASRRVPPEALRTIAEDPRWVGRYVVKLALASNPTTPDQVVAALLPYLLEQDLRTLARAASRRETREQADHLLARRDSPGGEAAIPTT